MLSLFSYVLAYARTLSKILLCYRISLYMIMFSYVLARFHVFSCSHVLSYRLICSHCSLFVTAFRLVLYDPCPLFSILEGGRGGRGTANPGGGVAEGSRVATLPSSVPAVNRSKAPRPCSSPFSFPYIIKHVSHPPLVHIYTV